MVPGTALLEAAATAARLLLPAERAVDAAVMAVAIVAPLMLGGQVQYQNVFSEWEPNLFPATCS